MKLSRFGWRAAIFLLASFALVACDNAEERAEGHFESGVELLEAGDVERGLVELRNVLALNEFHSEARKLYAATLRQEGELAQSFAEYRHLVESDPADHYSRFILAQMSIEVRNWNEFERHNDVLQQANTEIEGIGILSFVARFREASINNNQEAIAALVVEGEALVSDFPEEVVLREILVDGYMTQDAPEDALRHIDAMIEIRPDNVEYYLIKARTLAQLDALLDLEDLLLETVERFPEENEPRIALLRLYALEGRTDRAEDFLRQVAERTGNDTDVVTLIAYVRQARGSEVALTEIETRLQEAPDTAFLLALKAGILFDEGERDEAIALMESITSTVETEDAQTNRFRISLARMLLASGNEVGARQLVETVLDSDASQTDALKMSAAWLIEDDQPERAIAQLRIALDQEPDDADTMLLMSTAHLRMGDRELAQDLLSLAVEASGNDPEISARFAAFLIEDGRFRPAEDVLINALRVAPGNVRILSRLADVYIATEDWARALQVAETLRRSQEPRIIQIADQIQTQVIARRQGQDQAIAYLEGLIAEEGSSDDLRLSLLRSRLASGQTEEAVSLAEELVAEFPDNPRVAFLLGNTHLAVGNYTAASEVFEGFVTDFPQAEQAWLQLSRSLGAQGLRVESKAVVDRGLEELPNAPNLLWAKASFLEAENDIDGAIDIYEQLYAQSSNSNVIANNLASLLATYRDDEESLERAYTVGRRLRGTDVAPFQDTYGWILHRRGDYEEAVTYLEPAAEALASDPIVQYHLAMTYLQLGQTSEAREAFQRVLDIAGADDPRPQIERAAAEIERLAATTAEE